MIRVFAEAIAKMVKEACPIAYEAFVDDEGRFDGEAAQILAHAMHASAQATWSAFAVERIARRLGDYDGADAVLAERLARTRVEDERLDLLQRRGLGALGAGRRDLALDLLGRALAAGGADAAQMLGREALASGQRDRAAALFRRLLASRQDPAPDTPWALRGWGLALLPPPAAHTARRRAALPGEAPRGGRGNRKRPQD